MIQETNFRLVPVWYTPADLPAEVLAFDTPLEHLGVGDTDKVGLLELDLACVEGTTRITKQYQQGPLYILHPIYVDTVRQDMAFIYTIQLGDGMVQGDRYRMDFRCAPESAVHITTQAASKIYRMHENFASQIVNIRAEAGAFVEYLPEPVIPFRESRFYQQVNLQVDPTASVIYGEILYAGRSGESHDYSLYYTDTEVCDLDGHLLFADRLKLDPPRGNLHSPGRLGSYSVLASLFIITQKQIQKELIARFSEMFPLSSDLFVATTALPAHAGLAVRVLSSSPSHVKHAVAQIWREARLALIQVEPPDLRKG